MKAIVVLPTYNEAENIGPLTAQVLRQPGVTSIIIVDDGSPDGTGQIADELQRAQPRRVEVLHWPGKLGLGTAYIAGFRRALASGACPELAEEADGVITMGADFSHKPDYIPELLARSRSCPLVIGSRYMAGGGTRNWGWGRRLLSRGANAVAHLLLGLAARDCTAGFRCYQAALLQSIDFGQIRSNGYSFWIELLFLCERMGTGVAEVPILFEDRRGGRSKISQAEILRAWQTVFRPACTRLTQGVPAWA